LCLWPLPFALSVTHRFIVSPKPRSFDRFFAIPISIFPPVRIRFFTPRAYGSPRDANDPLFFTRGVLVDPPPFILMRRPVAFHARQQTKSRLPENPLFFFPNPPVSSPTLPRPDIFCPNIFARSPFPPIFSSRRTVLFLLVPRCVGWPIHFLLRNKDSPHFRLSSFGLFLLSALVRSSSCKNGLALFLLPGSSPAFKALPNQPPSLNPVFLPVAPSLACDL